MSDVARFDLVILPDCVGVRLSIDDCFYASFATVESALAEVELVLDARPFAFGTAVAS